MKLAPVRNGESRQRLRFWVQFHLPKSGGEIQSGEYGRFGSSDVPDAFADFLHGIFVNVGVLVEQPKVLYDLESLALLLWYAEYGRVVAGGRLPYHSQFEPFIQALFDKLSVCFR